MLADKIESSDEYLAYSKKILTESGVLKEFPKISDYYYDLCAKFKCTFNDMELTPLKKMRDLLDLDAQIQILLELTLVSSMNLVEDYEMSEEEIIQMILNDKKTYYRELTGGNTKQAPKWGLIYLSEE
ncbi:DUF7006 family protein [Enterococcus casseliflavus]|uniref:DUF7006 family protein n=1 Tax=Enterococcus casseliflavus TaxID=37734 RepID=UPI001BCFBC52|nr:hypothetical protein [Enterococcus casseliflavus]